MSAASARKTISGAERRRRQRGADQRRANLRLFLCGRDVAADASSSGPPPSHDVLTGVFRQSGESARPAIAERRRARLRRRAAPRAVRRFRQQARPACPRPCLLGLITRFWRATVGLRPLTRACGFRLRLLPAATRSRFGGFAPALLQDRLALFRESGAALLRLGQRLRRLRRAPPAPSSSSACACTRRRSIMAATGRQKKRLRIQMRIRTLTV